MYITIVGLLHKRVFILRVYIRRIACEMFDLLRKNVELFRTESQFYDIENVKKCGKKRKG